MPWIQHFLAELKRRNVVRALLFWGVAAFAVLQVYEPVMHGLHLPEWTLSFVVVVLGLGFPITAALAWAFELTASGLERTAPVPAPDATAAAPAPSSAPGPLRLGLLLAGLGLAAAAPGLVYFFVWQGPARQAPAAGAQAAAEQTAAPSIAVLPFVNMSPDKDQEYFSDGISEEILNALAQVKGLRVIGRTSSFSMKGRNEDLRTVGQRLNAANLLEGSVRRAGTKVRITAQLVEAAGGSHLWSQEFDRELTDVFAVQEEIARAVVAALQVALLPGAAAPARTVDAEAHDLYLRGRELMARGSGEGFDAAVPALEKAVARDAGYAPAWAALAAARFWAADQGSLDQRTEWPKALAAAERAIAVAPAAADGYLARGLLRQGALQDWAGALADLERARELNPGSPDILHLYGALLATLGRLPEAAEVLEKAVLLDPLHANAHVGLALVRSATGQLDLAFASATRALELAPQNNRAARTLGFVLLLQRRLPEARAAFRRSTNVLFSRMGDAMVDHTLGNAAASQRMLDAIMAEPGVHEGGAYQVAQTLAWRGELGPAFEWLDRAVEAHDPGVMYLKYDPVLRPLRADPRYRALLARVRLPLD